VRVIITPFAAGLFGPYFLQIVLVVVARIGLGPLRQSPLAKDIPPELPLPVRGVSLQGHLKGKVPAPRSEYEPSAIDLYQYSHINQ
jgi:hypothetical protein